VEAVVFYGFGGLAVVAALLMVLARSPLNGVLWLVVCFVGIAGLFAALDAHFLAAVQVLVYAGAILVLFLFVIMLLNLRPGDLSRLTGFSLRGGGAWGFGVGVLGFAAVVTAVILGAHLDPVTGKGGVTTLVPRAMSAMEPLSGGAVEVAVPLFSTYLLPFEAVSLLLLAAIVGAVALTKKRLP